MPFSFWEVPRAFFQVLGQFLVEYLVAATKFVALLLVRAYAAWTSPPRRRRRDLRV